MRKSIFLKQTKPLIATILGIVILVLILFLLYDAVAGWSQIVTMLGISMVLLGYSVWFEIEGNFNHKKHFKFFGFTVFKQSLECILPDYITVFAASFKKDSEWGPVAAMGNQTKEGNYVVRFFKGNEHFTVWKSNSLALARTKATELGQLLNTEVRLKK